MHWNVMTTRFRELRSHPGYRHNPPLVLARAASWWIHCRLGLAGRAKFRRWDFTLYLPPKWHGGGSTSPFLFREHYEPELMLLEQFLRPGMTFVDGGANTGVFTFAAARLVGKEGCVLAFEPGRHCFDALEYSVALNGMDHVVLHRSALADSTSRAKLFHHFGQDNSYSLGGDIDDGDIPCEEVNTITLQDALDGSKRNHVDFIKLDVEGAEELVLRGSDEILARCRPVVLFEVNPEACQRLHLKPEGARDLLADHGYEFHAVGSDGQLYVHRGPVGFGNLLAIHKASSSS